MVMQQDAATPVLRIKNLTISLPAAADRPHAISQISLEIRPGEILCLVGESGSGKSVISQAVMGLLPNTLRPTQGAIELLGEDVLTASPKRLRALRGTKMSMVFQEPMTALNPVMTCGAQVDEILVAHTTLNASARRQRVLEIFQRVSLPEPERVYDSYPHQLSGGQRQRIVISIALILKPALLICDEPTTALDVTTQAEILSLIRELQSESNTAVLFITHDFSVVADLADRVVVLRLGEQMESGDRDDVLKTPSSSYTKMLLTAVPALTPVERPQILDTEPLLEARNIVKTYSLNSWPRRRKFVQAAKDISLRIRAGETIGIVGESGSGKSTVARCIASLIEPTSGQILVNGHRVIQSDASERTAFRRHVQVVFQDPYRSL